jgi:hypothetical protein
MRRCAGFFYSLLPVLLFSCAAHPEVQVRMEEIFPLEPFTHKLSQPFIDAGYRLEDFQYYLSTSVFLEQLAPTERFVINRRGEGEIWRRDDITEMRINFGTEGVLAGSGGESGAEPRAELDADFAAEFDAGEDSAETGERTLKILFDERFRNSPLTFVESPVDYYFYLDYDEVSSTLDINGVSYSFRYVGNTPPYLLFRLKENLNQRLRPVVMRGVPVQRVGIREEASFPVLKAGQNRDVDIPLHNYLVVPVILANVRLEADNENMVISPSTGRQVGEIPGGGDRVVTFRINISRTCPPGRHRFEMIYADDSGVERRESFYLNVDS